MEINAVSSGIIERATSEKRGYEVKMKQIAKTIFSNYPAAEHSQKTIHAAVKRDSDLVGVATRLFR